MKTFRTTLIKILPIIILVVVTTMIFSFSMHYPIMNGYDDNIYITNNIGRFELSMQNLVYWLKTPCLGSYLPLVMFSYMIDYSIWGLNAFGYHMQSLLWHILNVFGIYACMRKMGIQRSIVFFLSLIFAIHPQRVESVVWLSERKDVMCGAFYFWSIFAYLKYDGKNKFCFYISIVLFLCALLSKSMSVSLPVILFLYEFHKNKSFNVRIYLRKLWPFLIPSILFIYITKNIHSIASGQTTPSRQILVIFHNYLWYIFSNFMPFNLNPIYPRLTINTVLLISVFITYILIIITFIFLFKQDRQRFTFNIIPVAACYFVAITPVVGIYHIGFIDYADRFSYITSPFLMLALALILNIFIKPKLGKANTIEKEQSKNVGISEKAIFSILFCWVILLCIQTVIYAKSWRSIQTVFATATAIEPANHVALGIFGDIELDRGNYRKVLQIADRLENLNENWMKKKILEDNRNKANYLRGLVFSRCGKTKLALKYLEKIKPFHYKIPQHIHIDYEQMLATMASSYHNDGNNKRAIYCMKELIKWLEDKPKKEYYMGCLALFKKDYKKAVEHFQKTNELSPTNKKAKMLLKKSRELANEI